tara:strand:- start:2131 stop:3168 length:1038 start_codon:yes stop_codon:yes gene_type:complete
MTLFNSEENRKPAFKLALFAVLVTFMVIIWGAFTRLVDAGLGCPDWPGCYGYILWPETPEEIASANNLYPEAPVELDKTWPEMVHRYFASSLGLLAIGLLLLCWQARKTIKDQPFKLPIFLLGFVILQGMFGMWTVTLKLWPQVVTAHLLGGFATLSFLWLLTLRLDNQHWRVNAHEMVNLQSLKPYAIAGLLVVIAQIALGGWVTSNYAALACPDLPTCQDQWLPAMDFSRGFDFFQAIGPNYLGGLMNNEARIAIHIAHRIGAILTLIYIGWLCFKLWRSSLPVTQKMAKIIAVSLAFQFFLGLSNIWFNFPLTVAVAHNAFGAVLLLTLVTLNHRLYTASTE